MMFRNSAENRAVGAHALLLKRPGIALAHRRRMTAYAELQRKLAPGTACQPLWYFERFDFLNAVAVEHRTMLEATAPLTVSLARSLDLRGAGDDVFVVRNGKVLIADVTATGRLMTKTLLRDGDVFGACDIGDAGSLGQAAEAWADCELFVLPCAHFKRIVAETPSLRVRITRSVNGRDLALERKVDDLVLHSAEARIARTFISLAKQHGLAGDEGVSIPIALTYRELGQLVGLSDATVRQILASWCLHGTLETSNGMLQLRDPEALRRIAAGGPVVAYRTPAPPTTTRPAIPAPLPAAQAAAFWRAMKKSRPPAAPRSAMCEA